MHVVPFADHFRTFYIIVGYVHAARIGYLSVDDHNLAVVTIEDRIDPRELHRLVLVDFDASLTDALDMFLQERLVVGGIAETIEEGTYLHAFLDLLAEEVEEKTSDAVVSEVKVFEMHTTLSLSNRLKQVVKLLLSAHQ